MNTVEFFGLPGAGKSHLVECDHANICDKFNVSSIHIVRKRLRVVNFVNLTLGVICYPRLLIESISLMFDAPSCRVFSMLRICSILFERIGHSFACGGCADEGVVQAVWGFLYRAGLSCEKEKEFASRVLRRLGTNTTIIYVSVKPSVHLNRYFMRADKEGQDYFLFREETKYRHARHVLALLLSQCRSHGLNVVVRKN